MKAIVKHKTAIKKASDTKADALSKKKEAEKSKIAATKVKNATAKIAALQKAHD
jgi:hypothetical protein